MKLKVKQTIIEPHITITTDRFTLTLKLSEFEEFKHVINSYDTKSTK